MARLPEDALPKGGCEIFEEVLGTVRYELRTVVAVYPRKRALVVIRCYSDGTVTVAVHGKLA